MRPELQRILFCLRASIGHDDGNRVSASALKAIDWDLFLKLVDHHRVVCPVYWNLRQLPKDSTPQAVLNGLRRRYQQNTRQALAKTAELVGIVGQLNRKGIPVLPLKGPVVALQAYGDIGSRHVGDLDIMVSPEQALEAEAVLLGAGYRRTHPNFRLSARQSVAYLRDEHHFGYYCPKPEVRVELHWRIGSNRYVFPVTFNHLWRERRSLPLGGSDVPILSLEHTILSLCVHGSGHGWFRLFWLNDVAQLVVKSSVVDWNRLMGHAGDLGVARMVAEGILLSHRLLGSPLPGPVQSYIRRDPGVSRIAEKSFLLMNEPPGMVRRPFTYPYFRLLVRRAMLRSDLRYKLAFCAMKVSPSYSDRQTVLLPDACRPLYYLLRPFLWFFRWYTPGISVYREGRHLGRR